MFAHKAVVAALLIVAGASVALACGPDFPWQLLDDRNDTLKETPKNTFAFEVEHLAAPTGKLKPDERSFDNDALAKELTTAEEAGLSPAQAGTLARMRGAASGEDAYALGAGLPQAVRLYTAGAIDFHGGAKLPAAIARFAAVLALPVAAQRPRGVWAAYMLGRADALGNDDAGAASAFRLTRRLALSGEPDPLGLAVASYGEEARLHFARANAQLVAGPSAAPLTPPPAPSPTMPPPSDMASIDAPHIFKGYDLPPQNAAAFGHEMALAAALYSRQAANGSDSGVQSLRIVSENVLSDPARTEAAVADPLLQRIVVAYALARLDDTSTQDAIPPDAGTRDKGVVPNALLPMLVAAIERHGFAHVAAADRLAALCYRTGRYDLAAKLANGSPSPLAQWVLAKLAVQRGDLAAAEKYYAAAAHGFPATYDDDNVHRVVGESAVVMLARGEYTDALARLYPVAATYWGDVAYVAERVLTVDELKAFVDAKVPASNKPPAEATYGFQITDPAPLLRNLLARRLMQAGRTDEALPYFQTDALRKQAKDYSDALAAGGSDWGKVDRAEALFAAATLARQSGIDIIGTEATPDYNYLQGSFDIGIGQTELKGPYITANEHARFAATTARPNYRFHYRYIAVDEAKQAAALLPPRSQAYAAVLCAATRWMMDTPDQDARARALYKLYVANGPRVAFARNFGRNCPKPDFAGAVTRERLEYYRAARHTVSHYRWWFLAGGIALVLAFAALLAWWLDLPRRWRDR